MVTRVILMQKQNLACLCGMRTVGRFEGRGARGRQQLTFGHSDNIYQIFDLARRRLRFICRSPCLKKAKTVKEVGCQGNLSKKPRSWQLLPQFVEGSLPAIPDCILNISCSLLVRTQKSFKTAANRCFNSKTRFNPVITRCPNTWHTNSLHY